VDVLGIDVDADVLDQWRDWLIPESTQAITRMDVADAAGTLALSLFAP